MYVIKLGESEQDPYINLKFSNLAAAASYASSLDSQFHDKFTVGVLTPTVNHLDKFENEFTIEFKHAVEMFFVESLATLTGSDTDFDISYQNDEQAETLIRHFHRDFAANLNLSPSFIIDDSFVISLENVHLLQEISSFVYLQVPNTQTMVCNLTMISGVNVAGVSYEAFGEVAAKHAAHEDAIHNLLKGSL